AGEKVTVNGMFVHNTDFGANADQEPGGETASANPNDQNSLLVNELNLSWMVKEDLMIRAGRGSATLANGKVVSANDYDNVARAFISILSAMMQEKVDVNVFGVLDVTAEYDEIKVSNIGRFYGITADFRSLPAFL